MMNSISMPVASVPETIQPGDLQITWLIARRGAVESLRDRTTLTMSAIFALLLPVLMVLLVIRPQAGQTGAKADEALGLLMATYLLVAGLLPSSGSASVASGLFAGEMEQGNLAPLLATPASNRAIFGGKVLGAVLPSLIYSLIAVASYLIELAVLVGPARLRLLPPALSLVMVALVPIYAVLGATVASLVSSRVRTYQSAQMVSSLVLLPVMTVLIGLAFAMRQWGAMPLVLTVAGLIALAVVLILLAAATWRREEMMARR